MNVFNLERMGSVRLYLACDSPYDENRQPYHTGSLAAPVNKDRAFRRTPGRRCRVCYWCIIEDSWKRRHHHRHMEHRDTKSRRETPGTNTRNGKVQMEHPWSWTVWHEMDDLWRNNNRERTQVFLFLFCFCFSVEKRINTSMSLDFLFTRTSWTLS